MAKLNGWLTISRLNGKGNAAVTLTTSANETGVNRSTSLKIKTSTKEAIINVYQQHYEEPLIPDNIPNNQIWVKSTDGTTISPSTYAEDFEYDIVKTELRFDGWAILTFGGDITYIPSYRFYELLTVTEVVIPKSVTSIGKSAFYGCTSLTSINLTDNLTTIEDYALGNCGFTNLTIPNSVTSIGEYAFYACRNLESIIISDRVTEIKVETFRNCSSLTSVTIGNSVTSIGNCAFMYCSSLPEITIPDSVTSIGDGAFEYCSSLSSVTIGNSVTEIGSGTFYDCGSLNSITCKSNIAPSIWYNTFLYAGRNGVLYYPQGSDYSDWLSSNQYYLGYWNWTGSPY